MQRIGRHAVGRELTAKGLLSSFEADHEGAPVLLRVFMAGIQADAADVRRFEEQAQITAGLDHPGVARLVGWSASDPVHVSTPPLRGATLAEVCAAAPPKRLDPLVVAALAAELAAAFGAAHASGLVHAGLSPDTIVIGTDGHAKIIDFALARFITSLSASSSQVMRGAIECLAPEHIESPDDIGPPTDVFGLGVVMYRAMTGQEPFEAASALATSILLSIGKPTPIEARGVSIPEPLGQLVMSMLAREPSERPTMRDIAGSLSSMAALPSGPYLDTMRELVASSASWLPRAAAAPAPAAAPAAAPRPAPVAPAPVAAAVMPAPVAPAPSPAPVASAPVAPAPVTARAAPPLVGSVPTPPTYDPTAEHYDDARPTIQSDGPILDEEDVADFLRDLTVDMPKAKEGWFGNDDLPLPKTVVLPDPRAAAQAAQAASSSSSSPSTSAASPSRAQPPVAAPEPPADRGGSSEWLLWVAIGVGALVLLGGTVAAAMLLGG